MKTNMIDLWYFIEAAINGLKSELSAYDSPPEEDVVNGLICCETDRASFEASYQEIYDSLYNWYEENKYEIRKKNKNKL